jgi:hypothetical protein
MNRRGFIGGSDCVKIIAGEWSELWEVKTGRSEPEDLSDILAVQLGIHTEDFNLNWYEKQTGAVLSDHQWEIEDEIEGIPVKGTLDAMHGNAVVEAKHTNAFSNMDNVIERYMPQLQLYMALAGAPGAHLSVIFGNSKWESVYVKADGDYFNSMWAVVSDFWSYVVGDQRPVDFKAPIISTHKIAVDEMVVRDASKENRFVDAATFEGAKKDLKQMVADNERLVFCDQLQVRRAKNGSLRIVPSKGEK